MASSSRIRQRQIARRIAFDEIDLERERQSADYDYDDDVARGEVSLVDVGRRFLDRFENGGANRRYLDKAGAMIVAALEVNSDTEDLR